MSKNLRMRRIKKMYHQIYIANKRLLCRKSKFDGIKPFAPMHPLFSHAIDASSRSLKTDYCYIPRFFCPHFSDRRFYCQFNFRYFGSKKSIVNPCWTSEFLNGILKKSNISIFLLNNSFQHFSHCLPLFHIFPRFRKVLKLHRNSIIIWF